VAARILTYKHAQESQIINCLPIYIMRIRITTGGLQHRKLLFVSYIFLCEKHIDLWMWKGLVYYSVTPSFYQIKTTSVLSRHRTSRDARKCSAWQSAMVGKSHIKCRIQISNIFAKRLELVSHILQLTCQSFWKCRICKSETANLLEPFINCNVQSALRAVNQLSVTVIISEWFYNMWLWAVYCIRSNRTGFNSSCT